MNQGRTVFSQLVEFLLFHQFQILQVDRYQGNRYSVKDFSWLGSVPLFGLCSGLILSRKPSRYRSLFPCSANPKLYHMGFRGQVSRQHVGTSTNTRVTGGSTPISPKS